MPSRPLVVLNVAEKPSVARALAGVFSKYPGAIDRPMQRDGAQIFVSENVRFPAILSQGSGQLQNNAASDAPHTMITTSVRGHLASTEFGPQYGWSSCPPSMLFEAPIDVVYKPDMEPLVRMLKAQSRNAFALVLWLDCDREGEAICDEVRTVCLESNPRLNGKIFRAKFSTVLSPEIKRALRSLGTVNEAFVQAVQARSEHDLRVGAAFTRFQTLRLQKKFEGLNEGVISYGPCQFPTLGFVVERWARIETFISEDFWFLEMSIRLNPDGSVASEDNVNDNKVDVGNRPNMLKHEKNSSTQQQAKPIYLKWARERLYDKLLTLLIYERCLEAGEAEVTDLTGRPKNKWRPVPLATVELQKRASRYLRIGSENVMTAAEELYQQGYISYPRTETERFRPEFQHRPLIEEFQNLGGEWGNYARKLLSENYFQNPRQGKSDDNAHPPITPAKAVNPESIADRTQRGIYSLVVKHYLACCSRDAVGKETILTLKITSEEFKATGLIIIERNWLEIYAPWERWSTGQGELPNVQKGSRIKPSTLVMKEGKTTPPQPISEVELIGLMDKNGIGTDATIAQHITTIQDRSYATKDANQKFLPTKLGIALVEGYNSMGYQLNKPDLRREMEAECNAVSQGQKTRDQILGPILAKMRACFDVANTEAQKLDAAISKHYSAMGSNHSNSSVIRNNFSLCGTCKKMMCLKKMNGTSTNRGTNNRNKNNNDPSRRKLLYCSTCTQGLPLPRGEPSPKLTEQSSEPFLCPICQYQVVQISSGSGYTGNGYQVCPHCFSDPPVEHGGSESIQFRCFSCTHPTCSLAGGTKGGDIEVFPCPFCESKGTQGKITLKKNSRGYVLQCSNSLSTSTGVDRCQYTIWLPREAKEVSVVDAEENTINIQQLQQRHAGSICLTCSSQNKIVRKIKFVWKPRSVPPHMGNDCTTCILCDMSLREELSISFPSINKVRARKRAGTSNINQRYNRNQSRFGDDNNRNNTTTARNNNTNRNNNRQAQPNAGRGNRRGGGTGYSSNQVTCYKCGKPGHFANSCPQTN